MTEKQIEKLMKQAWRLEARLQELREANPEIAALEEQLEGVKKTLREFALENGDVESDFGTVKVSTRTTWDAKKLDGFAVANPEVLEFRKVTPVATVKLAK